MFEQIIQQSFIINEQSKQLINEIVNDGGFFVELLQKFIVELGFNENGNSKIVGKNEEFEENGYKKEPQDLEKIEPLENSSMFKNFTDSTFYLVDSENVYKLLHFLVKHQIKVIQYFRLIPQIYKNLPETLKNTLINYQNYLENILNHDSDKLTDVQTIKYYFTHALMESIINKLKEQEQNNASIIKILSTISLILKRIHGHNNKHHNEYYSLHADELENLKQNPLLALEFVLDTASINDKYNQLYGTWYESYRDKDIDLCKPMRTTHDNLITVLYNSLNKLFYQGLKQEDIVNTTETSLKHNKDVYTPLNDEYGFNMEFIKSVNRNLALLFVKSWKETKDIVSIEDLTGQSKKLKEKRERLLTSLSSIDKFKQRILDEKFDLKTIISDIKKITNREVRLMELSAILSVFKEKNELLKETCIEELKTLIYKDLTEDENEELKKLQNSTKDLLRYESEDEFYIATKNDCPYIF